MTSKALIDDVNSVENKSENGEVGEEKSTSTSIGFRTGEFNYIMDLIQNSFAKLALEKDKLSNERENVEEDLKICKRDAQNLTLEIKAQIQELKNQITTQKESLENLQGKQDQCFAMFQTQQNKIDTIDTKQKSDKSSLDRRISALETSKAFLSVGSSPSTKKPSSGSYTWRIQGWSQQVSHASSGQQRWTESPNFYTGDRGYKLRIMVHPYGSWEGPSQHVSFYIYHHPGEYDDELEWPFTHFVTCTLVYQGNSCDKGDCNVIKRQPNNVQRIYSQHNTVGDFKRFVTLDYLNSHLFVKNNEIVVKIEWNPK